jgi:hypothetical protein
MKKNVKVRKKVNFENKHKMDTGTDTDRDMNTVTNMDSDKAETWPYFDSLLKNSICFVPFSFCI